MSSAPAYVGPGLCLCCRESPAVLDDEWQLCMGCAIEWHAHDDYELAQAMPQYADQVLSRWIAQKQQEARHAVQ